MTDNVTKKNDLEPGMSKQTPFEKAVPGKSKPDTGTKPDLKHPETPDAGIGATEDQVAPVQAPKGSDFADEPKQG